MDALWDNVVATRTNVHLKEYKDALEAILPNYVDGFLHYAALLSGSIADCLEQVAELKRFIETHCLLQAYIRSDLTEEAVVQLVTSEELCVAGLSEKIIPDLDLFTQHWQLRNYIDEHRTHDYEYPEPGRLYIEEGDQDSRVFGPQENKHTPQ